MCSIGEGQKETPGRGRDRKCHERASLSRPLVLSLGPLTSLTSFPLFCTSEDINGRGGGGCICVKQVQCGKLAFSQGNRALFGSKMGHFRRFDTTKFVTKIRRDFRRVWV